MDRKIEYKRIIFVDENGTCRAPMAAEILRDCMPEFPIEILSRGLIVLFPEPINQKAEAVMISNGLHLTGYQTAGLQESDLDETTLVICFEDVQKERIRAILPPTFPDEQIQVLHEIVGDELEIMNPYGAPLLSYGLLYESLNKSITKLAELMED